MTFMAETWFLTGLVVGIPMLSALIVWASDADISERHHSHHDTYVIANTFSWGIVFAMAFMGALGVLLTWLCVLSVFEVDSIVVLAFFGAFHVTAFALWVMLRRYKVVTFDDFMTVTPFFGPTVTIRYEDISAMEWVTSLTALQDRSVSVFVGHRRRALLRPMVDLEQILIRIDRFDVLQSLSS